MSSVASEIRPTAGLRGNAVAQLKTADGVLLHVAILDESLSGALLETMLQLPIHGHVLVRPLHAGSGGWCPARVIKSTRGLIVVEWLREKDDADHQDSTRVVA